AGADGPHGLVRYDQLPCFPCRNRVKGARTLAAKYVFSQPRFTLLQYFADADYRSQPGFQCRLQLDVADIIALAEVLPSIRMADDHVGTYHIQQHGGCNLTGK